MLSFETTPRVCLFWFEDRESEVPTTRICLAFSSVGNIDWEVTAAIVKNSIFWRAEILSVIESSNSTSLLQSGRREGLSVELKIPL